MINQSFLNINWTTRNRCILCSQVVKNNEKWKDITEEGIRTLNELAEQWKNLDFRVCLEHPYNEFHLVSDRITDGKVTVHNNCRITFRNRISRKESQKKQLPEIIEEEPMDESFDQLQCENIVCAKRQGTKHYNHCFFCNETKRPSDIKTFNDGGLSRCSTISTKENILICVKKHLLDELNNHCSAAKRLDIMLTGTNYDLFPAVFYHKVCYNRLTYEYQKKTHCHFLQ